MVQVAGLRVAEVASPQFSHAGDWLISEPVYFILDRKFRGLFEITFHMEITVFHSNYVFKIEKL